MLVRIDDMRYHEMFFFTKGCEYDIEFKDCAEISCKTGKTQCVRCSNSTVFNKAKIECGCKYNMLSVYYQFYNYQMKLK